MPNHPILLELQDRAANRVLTILSALLVLALPLSLLRTLESEFHPVMAVQVVAVAATWIIFWQRHRLATGFKFGWLVGLFCVLAVGATFLNDSAYAGMGVFLIASALGAVYFPFYVQVLIAIPAGLFAGLYIYVSEGLIAQSIVIGAMGPAFMLLASYASGLLREGLVSAIDDLSRARQNADEARQDAAAQRASKEPLLHRLREQLEQMDLVSRAAKMGFFEIELPTRRGTISPECAAIWEDQFPASVHTDLSGWMNGVHPEDAEELARSIDALTQSAETATDEFRLHLPSGTTKCIYLARTVVERTRDGIRLVGIVQDITARKRAEAQQQRLLDIINLSPDFIGIARLDGQALFINPAGRRMLRRTPEASLDGAEIRQAHPERSLRVIQEEGIPTALEKGHWVGESILLDADGREIPVSQVIIANRDAEGNTFICTLMRDISERIESECRLRLAQDLVDASADGIIGVTCQGVVMSWNQGAEGVYGYSADEMIGQPISTLYPPGTAVENPTLISRVLQGEVIQGRETRRRHKSGQLIDVLLSLSPIYGADHEVVGVVGVSRDVTELRRLEERNRRLAAIVERSPLFVGFASASDRRMEYMNAAGRKLFGIAEDADLTQWRTDQMHPPETLQYLLDEALPVVLQDCAWQGRVDFKLANGRVIPVDMITLLHRDSQGEPKYLSAILRDLSEEETTRLRLKNQTEQLEAIVQNATIGIGFSRYRVIQMANPALHQILGYEDGELAGQSTRILYPSDAAFAESGIQAAKLLASTGMCDLEIQAVRKNRDTCCLRVMSKPLGGLGPDAMFVTVVEDVTTRKNTELALITAKQHAEEARLAAEAASKAKSDFVANMTHELRTPLNAVLGMLQLLESTELSSRQLGYMKRADTAATHLLMVINDILDFAKIEAGKLELEEREFSIAEILDSLADLLSAGTRGKPIAILYDLNDDFRDSLSGDPQRLKQVLLNLAGNAVKFTDAGHVVVKIHRQPARAGLAHIHFAVSDTGIGMTQEQLRQLFAAFHQADTSITRRFGGTGLGLAISQNLVKRMGGTIQVNTAPSMGSTFSFGLDFPLIADRRTGDRLGGRALVVDGDSVSADLLRQLVELVGPTTQTAADAAAAMRILRRQAAMAMPIDAVFVEKNLTGSSGIELALSIQREFAAQAPRLILVANVIGPELELELGRSQLHPDSVLFKPATPSMIREALTAENTPTQMQAAQAPTVIPGPLNGMRLLVVDDQRMNLDVAEMLLTNDGAEVETAGDGAEGLRKALAADPPFDLILMDMQMPVLDGLEASRQLRARGYGGPIIAITANALAEHRAACIAAGMDDHMAKPLSRKTLVAKVLELTGGSPQSGAADPSAPPRDTEDEVDYDRAGAVAGIGGLEDVYRAECRPFVQDQAKLLADAGAALAARDAATLFVHLHAYKGIALQMGARGAARVAGELCELSRTGNLPDQAAFDRLMAIAAKTAEAIERENP